MRFDIQRNKVLGALEVTDLQHDVLKLVILVSCTWCGYNEESPLFIELVKQGTSRPDVSFDLHH